MPDKSSRYPTDWIRIAEKDWRRVNLLLDLDDADAAGFFLQQSIEKFLKAFLISNGWQLKRIHDLEPLINESLTFDSNLEQYRAIVQKISGFYFIERYPLVAQTGITKEDVKQAFIEVQGLVDIIKSKFNL
jgi:HEPN domain-containing protein